MTKTTSSVHELFGQSHTPNLIAFSIIKPIMIVDKSNIFIQVLLPKQNICIHVLNKFVMVLYMVKFLFQLYCYLVVRVIYGNIYYD